MTGLKRTPLYDLHHELGARMVPFAGWEMPVQYPAGVLAEHRQAREAAALFDVSHMGQLTLSAPGGWEEVAAALEALMPQALLALADGRQRYGFFTNDAGGIEDDLMVARYGETAFLVVNAARAEADLALLRAGLPASVTITPHPERALLALQGPKAEAVLGAFAPEVAQMRFMDVIETGCNGAPCRISRSGYTGEDGFEISVPAEAADELARALLAMDDVAPAGLGARDTLRLEAGLCLYGHDIDATTSPVEADLAWAIQKARRRGGAREGGFPGAARILEELERGPARRRVGLRPEGRAPMREGTALFDAEDAAEPVGRITSGSFGPSVGAPVAMGYVPTALAEPGRRLWGELRGRRQPVSVAALPFVPHRYRR